MVEQIKNEFKNHPLRLTVGTAIAIVIGVLTFGADSGARVGAKVNQVDSNTSRIQALEESEAATKNEVSTLRGEFKMFFDMYKQDRKPSPN